MHQVVRWTLSDSRMSKISNWLSRTPNSSLLLTSKKDTMKKKVPILKFIVSNLASQGEIRTKCGTIELKLSCAVHNFFVS